MGSIWGRLDPGGPYVGPMNFPLHTIPVHPTINQSPYSSMKTHVPLELSSKYSWRTHLHYSDVIMASQITSFTIVYSTVYSGADPRKHQSSTPLAFVWGNHRWPVNSPHKGPVMRKMFPFDDVVMSHPHVQDMKTSSKSDLFFIFFSIIINFSKHGQFFNTHPCFTFTSELRGISGFFTV